jgi:hypothetical protein
MSPTSPPFTGSLPLTTLPVYGYLSVSPFVVNSSLLPVSATLLAAGRQRQLVALVKQAGLLRSLFPAEHTGDWLDWKARRQQLRRADLLREAGLPEATSPYFV